MGDTAKNVSIQIGPSGMTLLTIVLVILKVYDKIDWSWWWVFAPLWLPITIIIGIILAMAILAGIVAILE